MTGVPTLGSVDESTWAWTVAIVIGVVLVGLSWARLLSPHSGPVTLLLASLPVAFAVTGAVTLFLATFDVLSGLSVGVTTVLVGAAPLLARRLRLRAGRRRWFRGRVVSLTLAVSAGLGLLAVWPSLTASDEGLLPVGTTTWYYHRLAVLTAEAGGFPETILEWGETRDFQTDYAVVTANTAGFFLLTSGDDLFRLEVYRAGVLLAAFAALTLLLRRWVAVIPAAVGAALVLNTTFLFTKFVAYKPETVAFVLALLALWLIDRFLVERSVRTGAAATATVALVLLAHAEVLLILAAFAAALASARSIRRPATLRSLAAPSLLTLAVGAGGVVAGLAAHAVVAGELRLVDYLRTEVLEPSIAREVVPEGWQLSEDPTWNFFVAAASPGQVGRPPPTRFTDPRLLPPSYLRTWSIMDLGTIGGAAVMAGLAGVPVLALPRLRGRDRRLVVWWLAAGAILLLGALIAAAISESYVPRRVGPRRLVPYEVLPLTAALLSFLAIAWRAASTRLRRSVRPRTTAILGATGSVALCAALLTTTPVRDEEDNAGLTALGWEALDWMRIELPPGAVLVSNLYTDGSLTTLNGRSNLLDGRAGYLEDPAFLGETTEALLAARRFFGAPTAPFGQRYLACTGVDYLLVASGLRGHDLGGSRPFETDHPGLAASGNVRLVRDWHSRVQLYEVVADLPNTAACFG